MKTIFGSSLFLEIQIMRKSRLLLLITFGLLLALITQPLVLAGGRVEHHQITSKILADAGQPAKKRLSVCLPEGYDTSGLVYPVLYLIHGATGNNYSLLGGGYIYGLMRGVYVNKIADKLIEDGKIKPLIIVLPNMDREGLRELDKLYDDYLPKDITSFVDTNYRTIPNRQGRAISGHSRGGSDAAYIAFSRPDMFSLVGGYAPGSMYRPTRLPTTDSVNAHNQALFPLQFWIYGGRNDSGFAAMRNFANSLEEAGLPCTFVEDHCDHHNFSTMPRRLEESIVFFSEHISHTLASVDASVEPRNKITTTWGKVKSNK